MSTPSPLGCVIIPVTPFQQNSTLVWCTQTKRATVIDAGGEVDRHLAEAAARGLTIEKLLVTHGHADHCGGVGSLADRLGVPIEGPHRADDFWIEGLTEAGRQFGLDDCRPFEPTRWLVGGDQVTVGNLVFDVIHCPGHTPGHVVFHHAPTQLAFVGDVLFQGSIGRTDFPRGNHGDLIRSITERLWPLGNEVRFVPGHGPHSTFGYERISNPFVSDGVLARAR